MANTRDIRRKIRSVGSTMQITSAFELVSTAKLRRARKKLDASKTYFENLEYALADVLGSDRGNSIYLKESNFEKPLVIMLTSDRGLCGGFNVNAIKSATEIPDATFFSIGKKGSDFVTSRNLKSAGHLHGVTEKPSYENALYAAHIALNLFKKGEVDGVILVYSKFVSTISFSPRRLPLLPIVHEDVKKQEGGDGDEPNQVIHYEPGKDEVLNLIMPKYVAGLIFGAMIESSASEQAARRLAMEAATGNAEEIIEELTLTYNQARQAAITQEISEIVGGAEALS